MAYSIQFGVSAGVRVYSAKARVESESKILDFVHHC